MWERVALVYMVSPMASTCDRYAAGCTKTEPKILQVKKGQKQPPAPGPPLKRAKPGVFWVLERVGEVEDG